MLQVTIIAEIKKLKRLFGKDEVSRIVKEWLNTNTSSMSEKPLSQPSNPYGISRIHSAIIFVCRASFLTGDEVSKNHSRARDSAVSNLRSLLTRVKLRCP